MKRNGRELEDYLSEFRPRAVRSLQIPRRKADVRIKALAVAAALLLCMGGALLFLRRRNGAPSPITVVQIPETAPAVARLNCAAMTRLALESDDDFQSQLSAESRQVLPRLQGAQSTLAVLAKEQMQP